MMKNRCIAIGMIIIGLTFLPSLLIASEGEEETSSLPELIGKFVRIETTGRGNFQGILLTVSEDRVEIVDSDGEIIQISKQAINQYQEMIPGKKGKALHQDSASNRLIIIPTAFPMEKGEFHIADQELAVVTTSYGLNKNVSFWAGICPLGAVFSGRVIGSFSESFAVSVGSFAGIEWLGLSEVEPTDEEPVSGVLLPYSLLSIGKADNNFTVGVGTVFWLNPTTNFETVGAVVVLGGKIVLTATAALITENWIVWGKASSPDSLVSQWRALPVYIIPGLVFRIAGSRFSWDIGAILPLTFYEGAEQTSFGGVFDGMWIPIPWLAVTYRIR